MRHTKRVSVWLVGISGGLRFEGPVCHNGRITGWYTMWGFERAFQIDMAGACNATVSVYGYAYCNSLMVKRLTNFCVKNL